MEAITSMPDVESVPTVKAKPKYKLVTWIFYICASLAILSVVINVVWKASGTNRWVLDIDKDGTQVYSLKTPGSSLIKFKGVTKYKYSYGHMLSAFIDDKFTDNCEDFAPGCLEYKFIKPWDNHLQKNSQYWKFKLFPPFADREIVLNGTVYQDPKTKEILLENSAAPNLLPLNDCCVRITHLHNTWRYTPLKDGEVEVEFIQDFDLGGFFPDFLINLGASQVYNMMHTAIPKLLDSRERYRNIKFEFIEEYK